MIYHVHFLHEYRCYLFGFCLAFSNTDVGYLIFAMLSYDMMCGFSLSNAEMTLLVDGRFFEL